MAESAIAQTVGATPMQERLAEVYANEKPRSHTEALIKAGYSPATARGSARGIRERSGVKNALAARTARQRDKARELEELAGTRAIAAIETCEDPQTLVGTWSTARKARFDYPDETDHVARADSKRKFERAIHLAFLFGYIAAKRAFAYETSTPDATQGT